MGSQWVGGSLAGLAAGGVLAAAVSVVGFAPAESAESIAAPAPAPVTAPTTMLPPTTVMPPTTVTPPTTVVPAPVVDASPASTPEARPTPAPTRSSRAHASTRSTAPTPDCPQASCREPRSHLDPETVADEDPTSGEIPEEDACDREWLPAPLTRAENTDCDEAAPQPLPVSPEDLADVLDDLDVLPE